METLICDKKSRYASEKEALAHIEIIKKKSTRNKIPTRAYFCECGCWHITSKINSEKLLITNNELGKEIEKLKQLNNILNEINESLLKKNNKKENIEVKIDKRIQELNKSVLELKKTIQRIRKDNQDLIIQNLKLEKNQIINKQIT